MLEYANTAAHAAGEAFCKANTATDAMVASHKRKTAARNTASGAGSEALTTTRACWSTQTQSSACGWRSFLHHKHHNRCSRRVARAKNGSQKPASARRVCGCGRHSPGTQAICAENTRKGASVVSNERPSTARKLTERASLHNEKKHTVAGPEEAMTKCLCLLLEANTAQGMQMFELSAQKTPENIKHRERATNNCPKPALSVCGRTTRKSTPGHHDVPCRWRQIQSRARSCSDYLRRKHQKRCKRCVERQQL